MILAGLELGAIKNAGGVRRAELAGYGLLFTAAGDLDLSGDRFDPSTDLGAVDAAETVLVPAYYNHGQDPHYGRKRLGFAKARRDDFGVWAEYQLEIRSEYDEFLVEQARAGRLGQSSGAVAHMVDRRPERKGRLVTAWPIGELSLTMVPAEHRTTAALADLSSVKSAASARRLTTSARRLGRLASAASPIPGAAKMGPAEDLLRSIESAWYELGTDDDPAGYIEATYLEEGYVIARRPGGELVRARYTLGDAGPSFLGAELVPVERVYVDKAPAEAPAEALVTAIRAASAEAALVNAIRAARRSYV